LKDYQTYFDVVAQYFSQNNRPYQEIAYPRIAFRGLKPKDILKEGRQTIITGSPGSGKTTFLDWVAQYAASERNFLPYSVSLRNYSSTLDDLLQVSAEKFLPQPKTSKSLLPSPQDGIPPAFLLDGFDELPRALRPSVEKEILNLSNKFQCSSIVVSTRPSSLSQQFNKWSTIEIPNLSDEDISSFLSDIEKGEDLAAAIFQNKEILEMARKPLFLHTIRHAWEQKGDFRDIFSRQIPLYTTWRGHTKSLLPPEVSKESIDELLELLAIEFVRNGKSQCDLKALKDLACKMFPDIDHSEKLAASILGTDVVRQLEGDNLGFTHLSYIESYAARSVLRKFRRGDNINPLINALLSKEFGVGVAENIITALSDIEFQSLIQAANNTTKQLLLEYGQPLLAERSIALLAADDSPELKLLSALESAKHLSISQKKRRRDILVIAVHGFNTRGDWKNVLGLELSRATDGERYLYRPWDYGSFRAAILNPFSRRKQVNKFHDFFDDLLGKFPEKPEICIVAHSFGTYIVGHALLRFPEIKIDRLLMLGSALPQDFPWDGSAGRFGRILCITGGADRALLISKFIPGLGDAGLHGFKSDTPRLSHHSEPHSDHSDLFGAGYMKSRWLPFISQRNE